MNLVETLALISNIMIVCGGSFFIISIFGRKSKTIESLPDYERWGIKIALSLTVSGAFYNVLVGVDTSLGQVVLDFGLGLIFVWAANFHYKYFIWKHKK